MEKKLQITLTAARVNAGYSLDEVAKEMKKTKGTIINWEKGRTSIKIAEFEELCNLYKISKDYIILPTTLQKVDWKEEKYEKIKRMRDDTPKTRRKKWK